MVEHEPVCSLDDVMKDLNDLWLEVVELLFPPIETRKRTNSTEKLVKKKRHLFLKESSVSVDPSVDTWDTCSMGDKSMDSYDYISGKWRRSNTRNERDVLDATGGKVEL
ncbi:hypothetical protein TrRE_jg12334 [Triparma retinervis]|uniref:Uncharacterized protein n=1 Tax=Triparma retinervis TaxID=2557542 RepID=A0A9W7DPQ2_9STRA|nr:hypothetical protein TrRE_jg12334 [Triparma retinervis]